MKVPNQLASLSPHMVHLVKVDLIETKQEPQRISTNLFSRCFIVSFHLMWSRTFHGRFILHAYHPQFFRCPYIDVFFFVVVKPPSFIRDPKKSRGFHRFHAKHCGETRGRKIWENFIWWSFPRYRQISYSPWNSAANNI